ncbi:sugar ABC transporter ATP-binding protein [Conexibacter sp. CPCC 206217]|uniref:sugar ABC transporter ATP-binding protein n=1 Tax=Conexibacter sp. CPCC 206217 TaxID=3064574 RepID=UPI0027262E6E|nr:sugar ABC transporter ATP-binding protein [Conexibacter sp. CPCC 206217]MDO8211898.1 sugar ABC transporter ATP-binding protein [Conexibacter sp. CPCC 206217]
MSASAPVAPTTTEPLVRAIGVTKSYGGVQALAHADLELLPGEVHALLGENGAGKSTLVKIIAGRVQPDGGELHVAGGTDDVSVVYQELTIVPALSVLDNVFLGHPIVKPLMRRRALRPLARRHLETLGLGHVDLDRPADELTLAERQLVEIARATARECRTVILDEPTATLSDVEIERVFAAARRLRDNGCAVVWISHRLKEVFELADKVTVMRNGRHVSTDPTSALTPDELVARMIGSRALEERGRVARVRGEAQGPARVRLERLALPDRFAPLDLELAAGEIVGITGQIGSGADWVTKTVAGLGRERSGRIVLDGEEIGNGGVRGALGAGISYVSGDRARDGVFLDASVERNISSMVLGEVAPGGLLQRGKERSLGERLGRLMAIDKRRLGSRAGDLSGGNQQKVSLAKSIAPSPKLLVLNEPTRGVDVGARAEIYDHLRKLAEDGAAVLLFSTDLVEIIEACDRVVTMFRGRVVRIADVDGLDEQAILRDILHPQDEEVAA